jgi:MurNAc alpha-1-phosphate uridylyltransferase
MDILLALVPKENAFGDVGDGNYFIENGRPRRQNPGEKNIPYLYAGLQIVHPRIFDNVALSAFTIRDLFDVAQQKGRLGFTIHDGRWFHVGTPDAVHITEKMLAE